MEESGNEKCGGWWGAVVFPQTRLAGPAPPARPLDREEKRVMYDCFGRKVPEAPPVPGVREAPRDHKWVVYRVFCLCVRPHKRGVWIPIYMIDLFPWPFFGGDIFFGGSCTTLVNYADLWKLRKHDVSWAQHIGLDLLAGWLQAPGKNSVGCQPWRTLLQCHNCHLCDMLPQLQCWALVQGCRSRVPDPKPVRPQPSHDVYRACEKSGAVGGGGRKWGVLVYDATGIRYEVALELDVCLFSGRRGFAPGSPRCLEPLGHLRPYYDRHRDHFTTEHQHKLHIVRLQVGLDEPLVYFV